jgi:rubrerythrin
VTARLSRARLLRRGAVGGGALLLSGSAFGALARPADAATVSDSDLAYLRLLIGAELLAADFQTNALASRRLHRGSSAAMRKMTTDERVHYRVLAQLITAAGQTPARAGDIDFAYPKGAFRSESTILKLAKRIEVLMLGAYLGAVENVQTAELRLPIGQIAANEAQHVGALEALSGRSVIGRSLPASLQIDAASAALDGYES